MSELESCTLFAVLVDSNLQAAICSTKSSGTFTVSDLRAYHMQKVVTTVNM